MKMELLCRNVEEGDDEVGEEETANGKNPGTVHEQIQQQGKPVCLRLKASHQHHLHSPSLANSHQNTADQSDR